MSADDRLTGARHRLIAVGVAIVVLSVMGLAAAAFTPVLLREAPAWLLVLESRNRYLLLVASRVSLTTFVLIGLPRRLASDPLFFVLGRWYGDRAISWLARGVSSGGRAQRLQMGVIRAFDGALGDVLVFAAPGALVSVLAGAAGMSWRRFLTLNATGTLAALVVLWWAAARASGPIGVVVEFTDANAGWLTVVTAVTVVAWIMWSARSGGVVPDVRELADED